MVQQQSIKKVILRTRELSKRTSLQSLIAILSAMLSWQPFMIATFAYQPQAGAQSAVCSPECPSNATCVNGICVINSSQCVSDSQCAAPTVCIGGGCYLPSCTSDAQCGEGGACSNGSCIITIGDFPCSTASDCGEGFVCSGGVCALPVTCSTDANCPVGQSCDSTTQRCYDANSGVTTCTTGDECPAGQICDTQNQVCIYNGGLSICSSDADCYSGGSCNRTCIQIGSGLGFCSAACNSCETDFDCFSNQNYCQANPHCLNNVCTYEATNNPGCAPLTIYGPECQLLLPTKLNLLCAQQAQVFSGISVNSVNRNTFPATVDRVLIADAPGTLDPNTYGYQFSNDAFQDVKDFFELPDTPIEKERVALYERDAARVFLFNRLVSVVRGTNNQPYDAAVASAYYKLLINFKQDAALRALQEYDKWDPPIPYSAGTCTGQQGDGSAGKPDTTKCYGNVSGNYPSCDAVSTSGVTTQGYRPPPLTDAPEGYNWPPPGSATCPIGLNTFYLGAPSTDNFKAYGLVSAQQEVTQSAEFYSSQIEMGRMAIAGVSVGTALALAGAIIQVAGLAAAATLFAIAGSTAIATVSASGIASTVGFGSIITGTSVGAAGTGGAIAGIIALPVIFVIGGIIGIIGFSVQFANNLAIRPALVANYNAALALQPQDIANALAENDAITWSQLKTIFLDSTLPSLKDSSSAPVPEAAVTDAKFLVKDANGAIIGTFPSIAYDDIEQYINSQSNTAVSARLSGGWFVPKFYVQDANNLTGVPVQKETMSLHIKYTDWDGKKKIAWRKGDVFIVLDPSNIPSDPNSWIDNVTVTSTIQYISSEIGGAKLQASIVGAMPTIGSTITGTLGSEGWYTSPVTVNFTCSGGVLPTTCNPVTINLNTDGIGQFATSVATDSLGNTASGEAGPFNIDQTAPTVTSLQAITSTQNEPNGFGWLNSSPVTVNVQCADNLSGVKHCAYTLPNGVELPSGSTALQGETDGITLYGYAQDFASNLNVVKPSIVLKVDLTAPTVTSLQASTLDQPLGPNAAGWFNSNGVAVTAQCADSLSGVNSCGYTLPNGVSLPSGSTALLGETAGLMLLGYASDKASNENTVKPSLVLKVDFTPPQITSTANPANDFGWYGAVSTANPVPVTVTYECVETLSGLSGACPAEQTFVLEGGNQSATASVSDIAGNTGYSQRSINIDLTAPSITSTANPANDFGWYGAVGTANPVPAVVTYSCLDNLSGIVGSCPAVQSFSDEGEGQLASGSVSDKAGNSSSTQRTINIDKTVPTVTVATPAANAQYTAGQVVLASWTAIDTLSGIATSTGTVSSGSAIDTVGSATSNTTKTFSVNATDKAGNPTNVTVTYVVLSPNNAINVLIATVKSQNLASGMTKTLTSTLNAAASQWKKGSKNAAINTMNEFIAQVDSQTGKAITQAQATILVNYANQILASMQQT